MRRQVVLDTGPLVAFLNRRDRHHGWATGQLAEVEAPLLTCEAVLSEACFLLQGARGGSRAVEVCLFGRRFRLPAGPAVLARLSGAPLLPVFCFRERHYLYRIAFRPPVRVSAAGDAGAAVDEAARALGREIEWAIRERPDQWFALGPVWQD